MSVPIGSQRQCDSQSPWSAEGPQRRWCESGDSSRSHQHQPQCWRDSPASYDKDDCDCVYEQSRLHILDLSVPYDTIRYDTCKSALTELRLRIAVVSMGWVRRT
jgi:hypothetical protein